MGVEVGTKRRGWAIACSFVSLVDGAGISMSRLPSPAKYKIESMLLEAQETWMESAVIVIFNTYLRG